MASTVTLTSNTIQQHEQLLKDIIAADAFIEFSDFIQIHDHIEVGLLKLNLSQTESNIEESGIINIEAIAQQYGVKCYFVPDRATEKNNSISIISMSYNPSFLQQFPAQIVQKHNLLRNSSSILQKFSLNTDIRNQIEELSKVFVKLNLQFDDLLKYYHLCVGNFSKVLETLALPDETNSYPACSFLNNIVEREKIQLARSIINNNLSSPLTIKELARQCGINECYLKKGFKAMYGKTIHEYREFRRIEKSKELILKGNCNINEVAAEMGYTSHAYFSTAFKKHTGIKPCDLLALAQ